MALPPVDPPRSADSVSPSPVGLGPDAVEAQALASSLQGATTPHPAPGEAPLGRLRARLQEAHRRRDRAEEARRAAELARALAARQVELETAVLLARRSLSLGDDPELRRELAAWLEGMGDPAGAAEVLRRGLEGGGTAADWSRVAEAWAHAGDGAAAADALRRAMAMAPEATWQEVLGAIAFWAPGQVLPAVGAAELLGALRMRARAGDAEGAVQDGLRALELVDGTTEAEALAEALTAQGRHGAADEVRRRAAMRAGGGGEAIHAHRLHVALGERDVARALGAALDGGADAHGGEEGATFDVLLDLAGLHELLTERIERRAERASGDEAAELYADLARTLEPSDPGRAAEAWARAAKASPGHREAQRVLAALGATGAPVLDEDDPTLRARLADSHDESERAMRRMALARAARRRGQVAQALSEALAVLEVLPEHRAALAMTASLGAEAGAPTARIEALAALGTGLAPAVQATLLSWAADAMQALGDGERARRLAERASQTESGLVRAAVTLARLAAPRRDRVAAAALERAIALGVATGNGCRELVAIHRELGQPEAALGWALRRLTLRPGDAAAVSEALDLARQANALDRLESLIDWVLLVAAPVGEAATRLSEALGVLEPGRARTVARRVLDALGPRHEAVRAALLEVAEQGDPALGAMALERWAASGCPAEARVDTWLRAARLHQQRGEPGAAARALTRAQKEGAAALLVFERLAALDGRDPEATLSLLEARAEAVAALGPDHARDAAALWRDTGAARWDWADDRAGAVRAWVRAAELEPIQGPGRLVRDLLVFAGPSLALDEIFLHAEQKKSPREAAHVLSLAALVAWRAGEARRAFDAAERAVKLDPYRAEALAIAEAASDAVHDLDRLDRLYDSLADAAKGRFGRRAAHYRAARTLERWGELGRAARHAVEAFAQVPSPGTSLDLMLRLCQAAQQPALAADALASVASGASKPERATWLLRAADACEGEAMAGRRVSLLLDALSVMPARSTVEALATSLVTQVERGQLTHEQAAAAWTSAQDAVSARVDGPDGARLCIAFATAGLRSFGSGQAALRAIRRALDSDGDIEEYATLLPFGDALASAELPEPGLGVVEHLRALLRRPFANLGGLALRLGARVAILRRDVEATVDLLLRSARRFDDDEGLLDEVRRARSLFPERAAELTAAYPLADEGDAPAPEPAPPSSEERDAWSSEEPIPAPPSAEHSLSPDTLPLPEQVLPLVPPAPPPPPSAAERRAVILQAINQARQEGDVPTLAGALAELVPLLDETDVRRGVLHELATLLQEMGDREGARARWVALLEINATDREALQGLEQLAAEAGDHEQLAAILRRRLELASDAEEARVLRLRRAALLEQRLGRVDEARAELESLLARSPDDASATRYLADLLERQGRLDAAGDLWMRAFRLQVDPRERTDLAVRAAQAFLRAGHTEPARAALDAALFIHRSERLLELRVEIERAAGEPRGLADALDELAIASMAPADRRAELLVEASRASLEANDETAALERVQRAARIAPHSAPAQLLARELEYRVRGTGTPQEATQTIEDLRRISGTVPSAQVPLHAFLLAEALDVIHGNNAGMRELSARHAELGAAPLIALGMAERLARAANYAAAVPFFEVALGGDLLGLRRRGSVALAAADAAQKLDEPERAAKFLHEATLDASSAAAARQRLTQLEEAQRQRDADEQSDPRRPLQELASRAVGLERARLLAQLARLTAAHPTERAEADRLLTEAITAAYLDPSLRMELEAERDALRGVTRASSRPPPPTVRPSSPPPPARPPSVPPPVPARPPSFSTSPSPAVARPGSQAVTTRAPSVSAAAPPSLPATPPPLPAAPPSATPAAVEVTTRVSSNFISLDSEPAITVRPAITPHTATTVPSAAPVKKTSFPTTDALPSGPPSEVIIGTVGDAQPPVARAVETERVTLIPGASVEVRQRFLLDPSNVDLLRTLRDAAAADHNPDYARALEHVMFLFSPAEAIAPPPVAAQREEPEAIAKLLVRGTTLVASEALMLVWENASQIFRRNADTYGVTKLDRVSLSGNTILSRAYTAAARVLGASRTPLFQRRSHGPVTASIAMLLPPAVILAGDPREESPELLFRLGSALVAAWPEHVLALGLPEAQLKSLLAALVSAFGPPAAGPVTSSTNASLAASLLQALPVRAQRRMHDLCLLAADLSLERALDAARRASHRAGLFLSGDLGVALRETIATDALHLPMPLDSFGALADACERHPSILDLLALAISPEYAEARWHTSDARARRGPTSIRGGGLG